MKNFFYTILGIVICFTIFLIHLSAMSIFSSEFLRAINIPFIILILILIFYNNGSVAWMSFMTFFFIDFYSVYAFGTYLGAGTCTFLILFWLYRSVFTNQSFWAISAMSLFGIVLFRIMTIIEISFQTQLLWRDTLQLSLYEIIGTTVVVSFIYYILLFFTKKKLSEKISYY